MRVINRSSKLHTDEWASVGFPTYQTRLNDLVTVSELESRGSMIVV